MADDYDADVDWMMGDHGFVYSGDGTALVRSLGGGWEVVCGVRDHRGEVEVTSTALVYTYHGTPKITPTLVIGDTPTRGDIRRLLAALGAEENS